MNKFRVWITEGAIHLNEYGIALSDVVEVVAYKEDNFTIDTIWVEVHKKESKIYFSEDTPGFNEVMKGLLDALNGSRADWRQEVLKEPFAENRVTIWKK